MKRLPLPTSETLPRSALRVLAAIMECQREGGPITFRRICSRLNWKSLWHLEVMFDRLEEAGAISRLRARKYEVKRGAGTTRSAVRFIPAEELVP